MGQTTTHTSVSDPLAALRLLLDDTAEQQIVPLDADACRALPDDHLVCTCNNVSAGEIRSLLADGSCSTLDDVQVRTRAGAACGSCLPTVAGLVDVSITPAPHR